MLQAIILFYKRSYIKLITKLNTKTKLVTKLLSIIGRHTTVKFWEIEFRYYNLGTSCKYQ